MGYILTSKDLTKQYGKHIACNKVNLHIKKGEIYGVIGRNGAGKTTILRMISGLSNQTAGEYSINSSNKKVGTLIENPGLYPKLSAYDNLKLKCIATNNNNPKYINDLLKLVGLEHAAKKKTKEFSLGMRQRLGIALALAGDPEIIILDEPMNGLDPQGIAQMRDILTTLSVEKNITIVISSHILDELAKVANSFAIIHEGRLIDEISSQQLSKKCGEFTLLKTDDIQKTAQLLDFIDAQYQVLSDNSIKITSEIENHELVEQLVQQGVKVDEIFVNKLTLEEYYLNLTGGKKYA